MTQRSSSRGLLLIGLVSAFGLWLNDTGRPFTPDQRQASLDGYAAVFQSRTRLPTRMTDPTDAPLVIDVRTTQAWTEAWVDGQLLAQVEPGTPDDELDALAWRHGVDLVDADSRHGLVVLGASSDNPQLRQALSQDPLVRSVGLHGRTRGAMVKFSEPSSSAPEPSLDSIDSADSIDSVEDGPVARSAPAPAAVVDYVGYQWHLGAVGLPYPSAVAGTVSVGVLDTGVAIGNADQLSISAASGEAPYNRGWVDVALTSSGLAEDLDIVDGHVIALDHHQHGSHIASTLGGNGAVLGLAPGVPITPVRVLDAENTGSEFDLVTGIYDAVDAGVDVLNLSLSFGPAYVPSPALSTALSDAADAGVVLVAATGNLGIGQVSWPAAHPDVIAVSASCLTADGLERAPYANYGPGVDLRAPGGCLDRDINADGHPDGILAEAINLNDPTSTGLWFAAGTSQAAAQVSAAAARLIGEGTAPEDVRDTLQLWADTTGSLAFGDGSGDLWLDPPSGTSSDSGLPEQDIGELRVAMMPYLSQTNKSNKVRPKAKVVALDGFDQPVAGLTILGSFRSEDGTEMVSCETNKKGTCTLKGARLRTNNLPDGWEVTVGGATFGNLLVQPGSVFWAGDGMSDVLGLLSEADMSPGFGWWWQDDESVGNAKTLESVVFMTSGTGVTTSPFGVLLTPGGIANLGTVTTSSLEGSGVTTSPFGVLTIQMPDGTVLNALDGSGVTTSPFGITHTLMPPGNNADLSPIDPAVGASLDGSALPATLDATLGSGGLVVSTGMSAGGFVSSALTAQQLEGTTAGWSALSGE